MRILRTLSSRLFNCLLNCRRHAVIAASALVWLLKAPSCSACVPVAGGEEGGNACMGIGASGAVFAGGLDGVIALLMLDGIRLCCTLAMG